MRATELENRWSERSRGFESLPLRQLNLNAARTRVISRAGYFRALLEACEDSMLAEVKLKEF